MAYDYLEYDEKVFVINGCQEWMSRASHWRNLGRLIGSPLTWSHSRMWQTSVRTVLSSHQKRFVR